MIKFSLVQKEGNIRQGQLSTQHGQVQTPAIFPWAINGCLSGLTPQDCYEIGVQGLSLEILPLTVHPGIKTIAEADGLHGFFSWPGPVLSMPADFPALDRLKSNAAQLGLRYQAPYTNAYERITATDANKMSQAAQADLQLPLFQEVDYYAPVDDQEKAVQINLAWQEDTDDWQVSLGGGLHDLRAQMLRDKHPQAVLIANLPTDDLLEYRRILTEMVKMLPANCLRATFASSTAELCTALGAGIDLVLWRHPLKDANHGIAYSSQGPLRLRQADYENVMQGLVDNYRPSFMHYLLHENSPAADNILAKHNLSLLVNLMHDWRKSIGSSEQVTQFNNLQNSITLLSQ